MTRVELLYEFKVRLRWYCQVYRVPLPIRGPSRSAACALAPLDGVAEIARNFLSAAHGSDALFAFYAFYKPTAA